VLKLLPKPLWRHRDPNASREALFNFSRRRRGVNVAARLEALAEPGGICVSRVVRDEVRDKLDVAFEDMGEQQVKNIAQPIRAQLKSGSP